MKWINDSSRVQIEFNLENVIFGFEDKRNDALNCMLAVIKLQLFFQKFNNKIPNFSSFKMKIRREIYSFYIWYV